MRVIARLGLLGCTTILMVPSLGSCSTTSREPASSPIGKEWVGKEWAKPAALEYGSGDNEGDRPLLQVDRRRSPLYRSSLATYLRPVGVVDGQNPWDPPKILKVARSNDIAFLLVRFHVAAGARFFLFSLKRSPSGWTVEGSVGLQRIERKIPERGSGGFIFQPVPAEPIAAFPGLGDPTIDRIEAVDPMSRLIDRDVPTRGRTLFLTNSPGQIRVYRGTRVIGAISISQAESPLPAQTPNAQAKRVARRFVSSLLGTGWEAAAKYFHPENYPQAVLPPFEDLFVEIDAHLGRGRPELSGEGLVFPLDTRSGEAMLGVTLARTGDVWTVTACAFAIEVD